LLPDALYPTLEELDLTSPVAVESFLDEARPAAIINCAAHTAVDRAEEEEEFAGLINADAVGTLTEYAAAQRIPLITYSTDYVFDGRGDSPYLESHATDPINAYGRTKRRGELLALEYAGALVIRTSWVISGTHPNFVATMIRLAQTRDTFAVVDDQWGCPTISDDLARASLEALDKGARGILHMTNQGPTTWYRLARRSVELAGFDADKISPCTTADYPLPAPRPAYSVLGSERLEALGIEPLPTWESSLPEVVSGLLAISS
jgi:dTDP-4-dehydrorhamnose reductase